MKRLKPLTLAEQRNEILRVPQAEIARRLRTDQSCVSKVERGHKPRPWERQRWADAYEISLARFEKLVLTARRIEAAKKPVSETEPLMATAQTVPAETIGIETGLKEREAETGLKEREAETGLKEREAETA